MTVIIRRANLADLHDLHEIEVVSFARPWSESALRTFIEADTFRTCLVAVLKEDQTKVVGYIGLQYVMDEGEISNVAVLPQYRKGGIGFILLEAAEKFCKAKGMRKLHLEVRPSNTGAISLYEHFGFTKISTRKAYYEDTGEDAWIYTYNIMSESQ